MNFKTSLTSFLLFPAVISIGVIASTPVVNQKQVERPQKHIRNTSVLIDQAVLKDLRVKNLQPNQVVADDIFLRRAYIKIIGRIPTHQEATTFLHDGSRDKRAKLIDKLVYSPGFNSSLFNYWADMLRLRTNQDQYGLAWHVWIREAVENNMPYDQFVHKMLAAEGHVSQNPAVSYYLRDRNMLLDNISNTVQVFLGTQIGCAQCHDHPYEDWTQKSYYSLAAFAGNIDYRPHSAEMKVKSAVKYLAKKEGIPYVEPIKNQSLLSKEERRQHKQELSKFKKFSKTTGRNLRSLFSNYQKNEVFLNTSKTLKLPHDYQYNDGEPGEVVKPDVIFGTMPEIKSGQNRLTSFADWVTNPANPQFTKTIANRLWKRVYGYALAEPIDDWTDSTRVSHPEALALVEKILRKNQYNIRETLRILYHTELFQREVSVEEITGGKAYQFKGPILERLSSEQIHDSLLTLEKGNIDHIRNTSYNNQWNHYEEYLGKLLASSPKQIVEIDRVADQHEATLDELKKKSRALNVEKQQAEANGETEKVLKIKAAQKEIYKSLKLAQNNTTKDLNPEEQEISKMAQASVGNLRYKNQGKLRSAELPAPHKNGNLMHQFGSSDRHTPDAASTHASIPQALTLLNGKEINSVTDKKGPQSSLPGILRTAKTNAEKLEILFIAIYGSLPTEAERLKYTEYMETPKTTQVFAKAMLNSKRFLFVK